MLNGKYLCRTRKRPSRTRLSRALRAMERRLVERLLKISQPTNNPTTIRKRWKSESRSDRWWRKCAVEKWEWDESDMRHRRHHHHHQHHYRHQHHSGSKIIKSSSLHCHSVHLTVSVFSFLGKFYVLAKVSLPFLIKNLRCVENCLLFQSFHNFDLSLAHSNMPLPPITSNPIQFHIYNLLFS